MLQAVEPSEPGSYYAIRGGALGWAMPGALGIKLANPDRPVVAVVGDGASMYTVQALWTAARYNIPVTYAICNNRSYRILKVNMDVYLRGMLEDAERSSEYVGMDFATAPAPGGTGPGHGRGRPQRGRPGGTAPGPGKRHRQRSALSNQRKHRRQLVANCPLPRSS